MDPQASQSGHSLTQDIIHYLEQQELEFIECEGVHETSSALLRVQSIINRIIANITNRAQMQEDYDAMLKAHNQYPLFELSQIIPGFCIDDDMYEKLTFRENLVVGTVKGHNRFEPPTVVGGLCLDIQAAKGKNPLLRKQMGLEQKLVELITKKLNKLDKQNSGPASQATSEASLKVGEADEDVQEFVASLRPLYRQTLCKFLVHLSSRFDVDGRCGGSRITAWVDRRMHTLEERRTEFIDLDSERNEKMLYCALQPRRYYVKHVSSEDKLADKKYYSLGKAQNLICEGANFVLMRYLAITRYIGTFETSTMYINGDMCRNIYECKGMESGIVNHTKLDLCRIYRTVIEECGITHHCITLLTLSGQLIKQEWDGCGYVLQLNPLAHVSNETPPPIEHLKLQKTWEQDMQLFSNFLDYKSTCEMTMKTYLADHPEVKNMIADYVQQTLLMKPEDVLHFTIDYFKHFCPLKPLSFPQAEEEESYFRI